ncbi:MAG: phosphate ABC transporter permease PstA [Eubacteriales bacterium]|nr:phosphate ABC transporter permease PstA [Eubacteriales bacterium]MDD3074635.1 phosphate ABC transporter permease PstA [Eubacteriales bacterium]
MDSINKRSLKQKIRAYRRSPLSLVLFLMVLVSAMLTSGVLVFLIGYIMVKGVPHITPELFEWKYNSVNVSLMPALINTIIITLLSLLFAAPVGIFSAIYLNEYAKRGNKFVNVIRITTETLAGIPSIVYGLFGMLFFVSALNGGISLLAGALTLAIMILPLIMRTAEEALRAVPDSYREGSYGLGAGKLRTVFKIVLPSAMSGILAGVILGIGRIVGETAALIYTAGSVAEIPRGKDFLFDSTRTLSVHMYALVSEGLYVNQAYATAVILVLIVILINWFSGFIAKRLSKS